MVGRMKSKIKKKEIKALGKSCKKTMLYSFYINPALNSFTGIDKDYVKKELESIEK